jgi:uncharacterized protein YndB with AHSA1/START domain
MLKTVALLVVVLLAVLLAYAATRPDSFVVRRTTSIKASPEKLFPLINDYHNWPAWSPYEKLDPNMRKTFSGAPNGKGAIYEWEGNSKAGKGHMEITDSVPASKVTMRLDFSKPLEGHNVAEFILSPNGDSTNVTWAMSGPSPYLVKVMSIFFNMDNIIGKEFETGLGNLKTIAEK